MNCNHRIIVGDVTESLATLPSASVHCVVTSPPYWGLRDYGVEGQIGLEPTPSAFIERMVAVFREVRRVLRDDGTLWLNMGDSYNAGTRKPSKSSIDVDVKRRKIEGDHVRTFRINDTVTSAKALLGIPWRLALALQADGWILRQDIVWHKPSPMPESVRDRCTKAHEYIFLLVKRPDYYFDPDGIAEPCSPNTHARMSQDVMNQVGSARANGGGKMNGAMRAVVKGSTRKLAEDRSGIKANGSFNAAMVQMVQTRNKRSVWKIATSGFKEAHFATFPPELPRLCISAGTSQVGCCAKCGAPRRRIVEKRQVKRERPNDLVKRTGEAGTGNHCANTVAGVERTTTGWERTCKCNCEMIVPCTVLDPFSGAGTTVMVANQLGRNGIGIELNPEYAAMSERRIEAARKKAANLYTMEAPCG